jgi:hypothetical protein
VRDPKGLIHPLLRSKIGVAPEIRDFRAPVVAKAQAALQINNFGRAV